MNKEDFARKYPQWKYEENLISIPGRIEFLKSRMIRGGKVLDVGCCSGGISKIVVEMGNSVHGLEINPESAEIARKRGIPVTEADLEQGFPFPDSSFDALLTYEIIEHIFDTLYFLKECRRVLKRDGLIMISTPNLNGLLHRVQMLAGCRLHYLGTYPGDDHGEHIRLFNVKTLSELLHKTGFSVETVKGGSYLPFPFRNIFYHLPTLCEVLLIAGRASG